MSIHNAISDAIKAVLADYLAPELVDKLSAQIVARAQPQMEAATVDFIGVALTKATGKTGGSRAKAAAGNPTRGARRKKPSEEHRPKSDDPHLAHHEDGAQALEQAAS